MAETSTTEELEGTEGGFDETPALHKLPPRRARFVEEYVVDLQGTAAAIRSGYAEGSAAVEACRLLRNAHVRAAIDEALAQMRANRSAQAERIRRELEIIAYADLSEVVRVDPATGRMLVNDISQLPERVRRAISEISQTSTERYEPGRSREDGPTLIEKVQTGVKQHSKLTALKMLTELEGFVAPTRIEHTGKGGGPIRTDNKNAHGGLTEVTRRAILTDIVGIPAPLIDDGARAGEIDMSLPEDAEEAEV